MLRSATTNCYLNSVAERNKPSALEAVTSVVILVGCQSNTLIGRTVTLPSYSATTSLFSYCRCCHHYRPAPSNVDDDDAAVDNCIALSAAIYEMA